MIQKKILILGGYGFLGSHVYKLLKNNYEVYRIGKYTKNDLIDLKSLLKINKKFDIIIHLAGGSSVAESINNPGKDYFKTVISTKELIKFIKVSNQKSKIIYISSPAVFGNSILKNKINPISPYGKNKFTAEKLLIKFQKKHKINLVIIRFFSLYGKGLKKQLLWDVLKKLKKKNYEFYGSGLEVRSWMHVIDAAKIIELFILNKKKNLAIINATGDDIITNVQLIKKIYELCGISKKPIFNNFVKKGDPKILTYSNKDLEKLNWKKSINFTKGLKQYIRWFQKL